MLSNVPLGKNRLSVAYNGGEGALIYITDNSGCISHNPIGAAGLKEIAALRNLCNDILYDHIPAGKPHLVVLEGGLSGV